MKVVNRDPSYSANTRTSPEKYLDFQKITLHIYCSKSTKLCLKWDRSRICGLEAVQPFSLVSSVVFPRHSLVCIHRIAIFIISVEDEFLHIPAGIVVRLVPAEQVHFDVEVWLNVERFRSVFWQKLDAIQNERIRPVRLFLVPISGSVDKPAWTIYGAKELFLLRLGEV